VGAADKDAQRFLCLEQGNSFVAADVLAFLREVPGPASSVSIRVNLLHKKCCGRSGRAWIPTRRTSAEYAAQNLEARDRVLPRPGNDAYWHGVFANLTRRPPARKSGAIYPCGGTGRPTHTRAA